MIYTFPREHYELFVSPYKYRLRSFSQVSSLPWIGARKSTQPHAQVFVVDAALAPQRDPVRQDLISFFERLKGQSGTFRLADVTRLAPWYDRNISVSVATWSDGSLFTDGSGFANGHLPPEVFVYSAAARGATYLVLGGFPVSVANVLRQSDLLEIKPNGIPAEFPHLYSAAIPGSSDTNGRVGIELTRGLRQGVAAGDVVSLRYPSTIFHMVDDTQGEMDTTGGGLGTTGFNAVEAVDLVP